jgi:hypothetical protein
MQALWFMWTSEPLTNTRISTELIIACLPVFVGERVLKGEVRGLETQ